MIDKKILWFSGAGIGVISIAIAITINIVINNDTGNQENTPSQLTCIELQQTIDNLGRPGLDNIPKLVRNNIDRIRIQEDNCILQGRDWSLIAGKLKQFSEKNEWKKSIGGEIEVDTTQGIDPGDLTF